MNCDDTRRTGGNEMTTTTLSLEAIVRNGLCIGCGLCQSISGADAVAFGMTPEGRERPIAKQPLDDEILARINATCPGVRIQGPETETLPAGFKVDPVWGPAGRLAIGYAGDPEIRFKGATGGVLTALGLYLIESGKVDFVLHVAASAEKPMRSQNHVSFDRAQVLQGAGSRYGPAAPLTDVCRLLDEGRRFAFIGKPCDVGAMRNLARVDPRVDDLVPYLLTLVCGGASEFTKTTDLIEQNGMTEDEVTLLRYRGHGNPGPTRIETRDGQALEVTYNELWEDEGTWRLQFRCKICPDAIGELADIAASDVWPGGGPTGEDDGFNGIIARTPKGLDLLEEAVSAGAIMLSEEIGFRDMDDFQPHQVRKKLAVHDRLAGIGDAGKPVPRFDGLRLEELAETADPETRSRNRAGTLERIAKGLAAEPLPRFD